MSYLSLFITREQHCRIQLSTLSLHLIPYSWLLSGNDVYYSALHDQSLIDHCYLFGMHGAVTADLRPDSYIHLHQLEPRIVVRY